MMPALPTVAHEHHERLVHQIARMPAIGEAILTAPMAELRPQLGELRRFLTGLLLPHLENAEATLYPELERMFQNRHSMAPMRREHLEIRRLVGDVDRLVGELGDARPTIGRAIALRRVVFRLYALLEIHLVEEESYVRIVNHGVTEEAAEVLAAALAHPGIETA